MTDLEYAALKRELSGDRPAYDPSLSSMWRGVVRMWEHFGGTAGSFNNRDGWPNLMMARGLEKVGWRIRLPTSTVGPDGWLSPPGGAEEEAELKTSFVSPGPRGGKGPEFSMYETIKERTRLQRYSHSAFLFGIFRQNGTLELVAIYYLPPVSRMNVWFGLRRMALAMGCPQRSCRFSLKQAIEMGAVRVF